MKNNYKELDISHVWHPYCQMKLYAESGPLIVEKTEGVKIYINGKSYVDMVGGLWNVNVGYGRKEIASAAMEKMQSLSYVNLCNFSHEPVIQLAEMLSRKTGGKLPHWFFCNSGSEGNDTAFKIARQYQNAIGAGGRYKIISFRNAYHGTTYGAVSATGSRRDQVKFEPLVPGFVHVVGPQGGEKDKNGYRQILNECLAGIKQSIEYERADTIAAFIMEPILGCGGVQLFSVEFMKELSDYLRSLGILLILDEVVTAFGRCGSMFGYEMYNIQADIVVLAKGLTSGYLPLGAVGCTGDVFNKFWSEDRNRALLHGFTSSGNPACCSAAIENINIIDREQLCLRANKIGALIQSGCEEIALRNRVLWDVRGRGLMIGLEIVDPKSDHSPAPPGIMREIVSGMFNRGFVVRTLGSRTNVITLMPPLVIGESEVMLFLAAFQDVLGGLSQN